MIFGHNGSSRRRRLRGELRHGKSATAGPISTDGDNAKLGGRLLSSRESAYGCLMKLYRETDSNQKTMDFKRCRNARATGSRREGKIAEDDEAREPTKEGIAELENRKGTGKRPVIGRRSGRTQWMMRKWRLGQEAAGTSKSSSQDGLNANRWSSILQANFDILHEAG